jgi:hypothetical protein
MSATAPFDDVILLRRIARRFKHCAHFLKAIRAIVAGRPDQETAMKRSIWLCLAIAMRSTALVPSNHFGSIG